MNGLILRKVHVVALFALILGAPLVANAAHTVFDAADNKLHVSYADLNLNNDAGVAVLYSRLQSASKLVCGGSANNSKISLQEARAMRVCFQDVLSRSVAKVGNAKLTAIHAS